MLGAQRMPGWTALFLATTVLTSVTGFMFPATTVTPAAIFGAISLAVLAVALLALYVFQANGAWRWIYVVTALFALYLNVFVLVVQAFQKIAFLHPLAPNGSEPPFLVAQTILLLTFLWLEFGSSSPKAAIPMAARLPSTPPTPRGRLCGAKARGSTSPRNLRPDRPYLKTTALGRPPTKNL